MNRECRDSSGFDAEYEFQLEEISFSRARELRANRTPEVTVTSLATWFASGPIQRAKYKDFTSIDWIFDNHKARMRKARIKKQAKELLGKLKFYYFCSQTWIVVVTIVFLYISFYFHFFYCEYDKRKRRETFVQEQFEPGEM
ncbi:hypothetical protein AX774_g1553 [Zancudomyces culisetae]|uniref:Uncharacterized protein n=1 Tax=Zancudomyces culisetae TaxID=1213189 RepID=A0A1R1PVB6_ZANCU|nr:hypothetical protein AX774_g1553 [Zancudomyces culisetae]|eukprot:OMH84916.1 hypothetical protein AX774_g1553 [Zancudomyces culisetae]